MKNITLLLFIALSVSAMSINKRFIRSIDRVELDFQKNKIWRGNTITINLDVILNDGTIHSTLDSRKVNMKDFEFSFAGDGEIIKRKKRAVTVRFNKELTSDLSYITATLKRDDTHNYMYKLDIKDYRNKVSAIEIISNKRKIYPNNTFKINVQSWLTTSETSTTGGNEPKLYYDDFDYSVSGCGTLTGSNGVVRITDGFTPSNNELTVTATLKADPSITFTKKYIKHYNVAYSLIFSGSWGSSGDDARCISGQNGDDGRDHDARSIDGENGEHGRNGAHGYIGQRGEDGENLNVYLEVLSEKEDQIILKAQVVDELGRTFTRYIGTEGKLWLDVSGGNGGRGGDGYRGGDGGDGGDGSTEETDKVDNRGYGGDGGHGGNGGFGAPGGDGGNGGRITVFYTQEAQAYINVITADVQGGDGARGGCGARGGSGGDEGDGGLGDGKDGEDGVKGRDGDRGRDGASGYIDYVLWK